MIPPVPDAEEATLMQTCVVPERPGQPPVLGEVVKCGHVGATWTVASVIDTGEDVRSDVVHEHQTRRLFRVTLEPISPHEVPVSFPVREFGHGSGRCGNLTGDDRQDMLAIIGMLVLIGIALGGWRR